MLKVYSSFIIIIIIIVQQNYHILSFAYTTKSV